MTEYEIRQKIEQYRVSDAPIEVKEAAIKKLEKMLVPNDYEAKKQYTEGLPDSSDVLSQD